jgi:methyl-accepting chemotaxis protein
VRHIGVVGKIWLSIGVFAVATLLSLGVSQMEAVRSEARLRATRDALFPAAQRGQEAEAAFERMAKRLQEAVLLEEASALDQGTADGMAAAQALSAAAGLPGLDHTRAASLAALASSVASFSGSARSAYAPMISAGSNLTPEMGVTSRRVAEETTKLRESIAQASAQLAADLRGELAGTVQRSAAQRWMALAAFVAALAVSGTIATLTIRRAIVGPIRIAISELTDTAGQVTSASGEVANGSQSLSEGAAEQAASLEETSASMEEMASMTRKNAENARTVATMMSDIDARVRTSNTSLGDMVAAMGSLQESSRQVAKIIKTIDEIAFQTNILALNAAVEAARAGEAGMGFAVVADEVRSLAQRSALAARDTAQLIEASIEKAQDGNARVGQVATSITAIAGSIASMKSLVDDVSAASNQQAQGIQQVSQAIAQMEQVTQRTAATAEESAAAGDELRSQAEASIIAIRRLERLIGGAGASGQVPARAPHGIGALAAFAPRPRVEPI